MNIEAYIPKTIEQAVRKVIREELEELEQEIFNTLKSKNRNVTENRIEPESGIIRPKELANRINIIGL